MQCVCVAVYTHTHTPSPLIDDAPLPLSGVHPSGCLRGRRVHKVSELLINFSYLTVKLCLCCCYALDQRGVELDTTVCVCVCVRACVCVRVCVCMYNYICSRAVLACSCMIKYVIL